MKRPACIIDAASGWGSKFTAVEKGPEALLEYGLIQQLSSLGIPAINSSVIYPEKQACRVKIPLHKVLPILERLNKDLAQKVASSLFADFFPIVLGGDHSIAVGTWNGVYNYMHDTLYGQFSSYGRKGEGFSSIIS